MWLKIEPALEVILEYRTDLFRAATMKKVIEDYQAILEKVVKDPGERIRKLMARNVERDQVTAVRTPAPVMLESKNGVAPEDDVQSRLVELWEAALDLRPIGVDEDFFELGGDSLLATRLFTQMETTFKMNLPLAVLLEAPTIRQVAADYRRPKNTIDRLLCGAIPRTRSTRCETSGRSSTRWHKTAYLLRPWAQ